MEERGCFGYGGFGHVAYYCKNMGKEKLTQVSSNRFEVLKNRVMQREEGSSKEITKDRREILREKKARRGVEVRKTKVENLDKEEFLREVTVNIGLERIDMQEGITVEALLDSEATVLVMSSEFARKQGFKLKKMERPIYVRNIDGSFKKKRPIEHTVEINIYYQGYKERTEIDIIEKQKWSVILGMSWLAHHNSEID